MKERVIKRYANRKMYDIEESRYVSLHDLAEIIRSGESIRVTDKTGEKDYTAQILRQIILEQSKQAGSSSVSNLHEWVRLGGSFLDNQWEEIRSGMEHWVKDRTSRLFKGSIQEEFKTLQKKVRALEKKIDDMEKESTR